MSVYNDNLKIENIIKEIARIKLAFPTLSEEFYDIFLDRIKENEFTNNKLHDAINNVIDNCIYPLPTIAQFLTFDKEIKMYNYSQILKIQQDTGQAFKCYRPIKSNYKIILWASLEDIEKYKLQLLNE
jgi:hypothetical protein